MQASQTTHLTRIPGIISPSLRHNLHPQQNLPLKMCRFVAGQNHPIRRNPPNTEDDGRAYNLNLFWQMAPEKCWLLIFLLIYLAYRLHGGNNVLCTTYITFPAVRGDYVQGRFVRFPFTRGRRFMRLLLEQIAFVRRPSVDITLVLSVRDFDTRASSSTWWWIPRGYSCPALPCRQQEMHGKPTRRRVHLGVKNLCA